MSLIPISTIVEFAGNARREETHAHIATLAADIEANGLLHPITLRREGDVHEVIAGRRRLLAYKMLGREEIPARIIDVDANQGFLISLSENMHRHPMTNKDKCLAIRHCYDTCGEDIAEVMGITHLAESTVRRYLEISQLPEEVVERLDAQGDDRLTLKDAHALTKPQQEKEEQEPQVSKPPRKKSVKSEPWIYNREDKAIPIPPELYVSVLRLVEG